MTPAQLEREVRKLEEWAKQRLEQRAKEAEMGENGESTPAGAVKTRTRMKANLPLGRVKAAVEEAIKVIGMGIQFHPSEAWDALSTETRNEIIAGYPNGKEAKRRFLSNLATYAGNDYIPGLHMVERHQNGKSVYVWTPPAKPKATVTRGEVGTVLTYSVVGRTSDGQPVYRDDETGQLGWVTWEEL